MEELQDALNLVGPDLERYGYAAVFGSLLLESFGLPLPGETMLIAAAALAARGDLHLVPLLATAWTAAVLGDNIGYLIGHFGGRALIIRHGARVGITEPRLRAVEGFFDRYGGAVVMIARFFALLRQLNGLVAGSAGMRWWRFLLYNGIGAALWVGTWGIGVYFLGQEIGAYVTRLHRLGFMVLAAGLGVLAIAIVISLVRRRHRRTENSRQRHGRREG